MLYLWVSPAYAQTSGLTFTGTIKEIGTTVALGIGQTDTFLIIKLDNLPNAEFRISSADDAVKFGLIEGPVPSTVVTPQKFKGYGWKVKLTCDNKGTARTPVYFVKSLERIE